MKMPIFSLQPLPSHLKIITYNHEFNIWLLKVSRCPIWPMNLAIKKGNVNFVSCSIKRWTNRKVRITHSSAYWLLQTS